MKKLNALFLLACVYAAVIVPTQAHAQAIFLSRTAFDSAYPTATVENWNEYSSGTVITNGSTLNGITYTMNDNLNVVVTGGVWLSSSGANGIGNSNLTYFSSPDALTFTFSQPLTAFAIDINTYASNTGAYTATLNNGPVIGSVYDAFPNAQTGEFIGFSDSTPFTSVTINSPNDNGDGYTLDELKYVDAPIFNPHQGSTVPEPSTFLLFTLAGTLLVLFYSSKAGLIQ